MKQPSTKPAANATEVIQVLSDDEMSLAGGGGTSDGISPIEPEGPDGK